VTASTTTVTTSSMRAATAAGRATRRRRATALTTTATGRSTSNAAASRSPRAVTTGSTTTATGWWTRAASAAAIQSARSAMGTTTTATARSMTARPVGDRGECAGSPTVLRADEHRRPAHGWRRTMGIDEGPESRVSTVPSQVEGRQRWAGVGTDGHRWAWSCCFCAASRLVLTRDVWNGMRVPPSTAESVTRVEVAAEVRTSSGAIGRV